MRRTRTSLLVIVIGIALAALPARAALLCAGDCGGDGPVTVDDLVGMITIALEAAPLSECVAGDSDHDGLIRVDEILAAVYVALRGCPTIEVDPATLGRCDPLAEPCLLPWPNDYFTVADPATATGRRLALVAESLPANIAGVHVDPSDQNRADGWSPGSRVLVRLDDLDVLRSALPPLTDPASSLAADAPIVLLDATTGTRHPFWAEPDAIADAGETPLLMLHPARNFADGHRLVVALRRLVDASGQALAPSPAFLAYRDGQRTSDARFEARRPAMERLFADLAAAGVAREELQLAWEFTVASTASLSGRLLAMRDDAFAELGAHLLAAHHDHGPEARPALDRGLRQTRGAALRQGSGPQHDAHARSGAEAEGRLETLRTMRRGAGGGRVRHAAPSLPCLTRSTPF